MIKTGLNYIILKTCNSCEKCEYWVSFVSSDVQRGCLYLTFQSMSQQFKLLSQLLEDIDATMLILKHLYSQYIAPIQTLISTLEKDF